MNPGVLTGGYQPPPMPYGLLGRPTPVPMPNNYLHPETQDWASRVRTAGGDVSAYTVFAVNRFVLAVYAAGIRDKLLRVNLFAGSSDSRLVAVRTPLFRGQSMDGAQYGNSLDTNFNFVAGDYEEAGPSGGLRGNGSTKYLATGFAANLLTVGDRHISAYVRAIASGNFSASLGSSDFGGSFWLRRRFGNDQFAFDAGAGGIDQNAVDVGFLMGVNSGAGAGVLYRNGNAISSATGQTIATASSAPIHIFARSTGTGGQATDLSSARLGGYSIGSALTRSQAIAYSVAMQEFQAAMRRQV